MLPYGNSASGSRSGCHLHTVRCQARRVRAYNLFTRGLIPLSNCYPFMTSIVPSSVSTNVTITKG